MIRVAHVVASSAVDGIGTHVLALASAQSRTGLVEPILISELSEPFRRRLSAAELRVVSLRSSRQPLLRHALADAGTRAGPVDVVHVHGFRATSLIPALRRSGGPMWRRPVVATCHGFVPADPRRRVRIWLETRGLLGADAVIAVSPPLAAQLSTGPSGGPTVVAIPNGVDDSEANEAIAGHRHTLRASIGCGDACTVVTFAARLRAEKRPDLFLDVSEEISRLHDAVRFVVVGDGPERGRLQKRARRGPLSDRVTFTGQVPDAQPWIAGSSLLLHPSDYEATPRVVLEAMAAGIPVVATAVGGVPYLLGHPSQAGSSTAGLVSRRGDMTGLLANVLKLLDDGDQRARLGRAGRERVSRLFSVARMESEVRQTYGQVIDADAHLDLAHERHA